MNDGFVVKYIQVMIMAECLELTADPSGEMLDRGVA